LTAQTSNAPSDAAPGAAEVANATEATDETLPAAETNERLTATAERTSRDAAPGAAEPANATEATEETLPAAEIDEQLTADRASDDARAPAEESSFDRKRTLYIGNLFFDVTETDVVKEFARFGTVTKCKIVRDSRGLSKG
jgi:RNA recognition motif-containing protein